MFCIMFRLPFSREDTRVLFSMLDEGREQRVKVKRLLEFIKHPSKHVSLPRIMNARQEKASELEELYERVSQHVRKTGVSLRPAFQLHDRRHNQLLDFKEFGEAVKHARIPLNCFEMRSIFEALGDSGFVDYSTFIDKVTANLPAKDNCEENEIIINKFDTREYKKAELANKAVEYKYVNGMQERKEKMKENAEQLEDSINFRKSAESAEVREMFVQKSNVKTIKEKPKTTRGNLSTRLLTMCRATNH